MSSELHLLVNVAVAVAVALLDGLLAHALRQPVIVGYLLAGIAIGPFTPGFIGDREQIAALAEVGVIFLMFALGIEFSLDELARVRGVALGGTTLQVLLTLFAGIGLGSMVGWPVAQGLFFGGVIAISSTMVVLKMLLERGEVGSPHGQVLLGMLIVQDLATVLLIVLLPQLAGGAGIDARDLGLTLGKAAGFVGATLFLGARVVPRFMAAVERLGSAELFLLTAVALALGTAMLSALLGLSPALGAFLGGLLLTETEFDHRVVAEVVPMRNLFGTLFFVSVGMLIDPAFVLRALPAVLGLAAFVALAKIVMTLVAVLPFRLGARTTAFTALGLLQIGEFSYLLARTGQVAGAISDELNSLILTSSVVTIILTPPAFRVAPAFGRGLDRLPLLGRHLGVPTSAPDDQPRLAGHAVVVGHGRLGGAVTDQLRRAGVPLVVVETDLHLVRHLRAAGIPAVYGDAAYPSVLQAAHPERAHLVVVALPDAGTTRAVVAEVRRVNGSIPILARAAHAEEDEPLRRAGATGVVAPEQAGAELLAEQALAVLRVPVE
jgi:CPA2 family monovalent cation:H+ antiporter-2